MKTVGYVPKEKVKKPTLKEVKEKLTELGIEFRKDAKLEELIVLIPEENLSGMCDTW